MLLEGLHIPLTTPFYPDGRLNLRKLAHNVASYSKTPAAGIAVLSRHGEPTMLSDEEMRQVLKIAIEAAADEKVMLAGVSRDSVLETMALANHAAALSYDAALVGVPSFLREGLNAKQRRELLTYFQAVADRSAIPLVLDSTSISVDVIIELAGHPRVIGLIDSNRNPERIAQLKQGTVSIVHEATVTSIFGAVTKRMLARQEAATVLSADMLVGDGGAVAISAPAMKTVKTRTKIVGFQILGGSTGTMLDALLEGAVGAMPAFAACAPQACYEVFAAWKDGDNGLAEEKQERLRSAAKYVEEEAGIAAVKYGCDLKGYFGGPARLPLLPVSGEDRTQIESLLQELHN
jgi:4-hydroxy-2-oxoglutarate aldolase